MARIINRALIGHQDFALGPGTVAQQRGEHAVVMQKIELPFIFRTIDEIRALDYNKYVSIGWYQDGPVAEYYFDPLSMALADNVGVIRPLSLAPHEPGRYILVTYLTGTIETVFDTIIASASDEYTPIVTGGPKTTFRNPYPLDMTNGYVRISLTVAPDGADFIVDVHMNGVSMFSTFLHIDDGMDTSVGSATPAVLAITSIPDDAKFEVFVEQVGLYTAGAGLKVAVTGVKAN